MGLSPIGKRRLLTAHATLRHPQIAFRKAAARLVLGSKASLLANGLPFSKWPAAHACVDSVKDAQSLEIRDVTSRDRITEVLNLVVLGGKCGPKWKASAIGIA